MEYTYGTPYDGADCRQVHLGNNKRGKLMASPDWSELKEHKRRLSEEIRATASTSRLSVRIEPLPNHLEKSTAEWIKHQVESEPYWFHKIEVANEPNAVIASDCRRDRPDTEPSLALGSFI